MSLAEGNPPGTTTFTFAVTLNAPAGAGGVTFDIATADGTATTADNDYVTQSLTGQSIPMGSTGPYNFNVTVNRDTTSEANETFSINVTNITGANAAGPNPQAQGTIQNDDVTIIAIHDVQGNGAASPIPGATVTVRGIVTLLKSNGFFLQEEVADYDADPNTSEGIFVFTSVAPTVAVGDDATVTGTAVEFNGLTEISPVTNVTVNSTGNALPAAIVLAPADLPPAGGITQPQLEKYESMRVSALSLTTVAPNDSFFDVETVLSSEPRPMREPGIPVSDPIPPDPTSGLPDPNIPIFDENPERLIVDTNGRLGATGETLTSNVTLTNVAGPLDFSFSRYRLINDANVTRTANMSAVPVPLPAANEFTIAGYNIENFNNNATQRQKAALTIRDVLRLPDIIGTVEIFDLADLQALATEIQTISGATYSAHLVEQDGTSEDSDQDVGYLVKTSRVSVTSVTQERAAETFINPNTSAPETLHDRPPLVLRATVDPTGPVPQPVIVVVNHLRSFIDVELVAGEGVRVREKRKKQAESLGDLLNDLQTDNPGTPVVSVGDYNAFQFNCGYDDSISVIRGVPTPDDQIVVDQSPDVVNPDYVNLLLNVPADQRYSFIFENTPQSLDHVLANTAAQAINSGIAVARVNPDFPETPASAFASDAARPEANSDHDPVVAYFVLPASADLSVTKTDNVDPVNAGQNFFYTVTVTNNGPDAADTVSWSDPLPAGTTFVSLSQPGGWSCTTPAVGANGTVTCSIASLAVTSAAFNITVAVDAGVASGSTLSNTVTVTSTTSDPNGANGSDTETTAVNTSADLLLSKTDTPDPVSAGSNISYQITLTNNGPSNAASATFTDALPAGTTFVSLSTTGPWTCTTPAVGANGTVSCTNTGFGVTVDFFTLVVNVDPNLASGTVLSNTATLASATADPNGANNSDTATTTVATSADLSVTKTDTPDPVNAGANLTYTITVNNAGPSNASTVTLTDVLPPETLFFSLAAPAGWTCSTPGMFTNGTVTCSAATVGVGNHVFTLVVNVLAATTSGTVINNSATVATAVTPDPNSGNQTGTSATTVATAANMVVTKTDSPDPVSAGSNITYSITVQNAGPSNADAVTLSDPLPAGTTFVSFTAPLGWTCSTPAVGATGTVSCTKDSSQVAGTLTPFTLVVKVDPTVATGTVITNTITVTSTTPDPTTGNESASATTTVGAGSADLSVTKTDSPDPVTAGTNLTYTITVNNAGPSSATTASLTDTLPAGTTFVSLSSPGGWSCTTPAVGGTGSISCSATTLPVGNAVFTLVVNVNASVTSGTILTNSAITSSATTDPNPGNETGTATTTVGAGSADLSVTKTDSPDPVTAGTNLTYTITVNNAGPSNATNAGLTDTLPAGTTFVSLSSPGGWSCTTPAVGGTGTITCSAATLAVGNAVFTLIVNVDASLSNGTIITNSATASSVTADPNTGNETGTATTTVGSGSADLSVTKTDSPDPVMAGNNLTYTITVVNAGPSSATTVALADTVPAGTTFVSLAAPAGWSCTTPAVGGTGAINCSIASLGVTNAVFTLVVNVNPATTAALSNTATVTAATTDPNTGNESATQTTAVTPASADVSLTKILITGGPYSVGQTITYTLDVANAGPSTATTVQVTDTPTNLTITGVSGGGCAALPCTIAAIPSGSSVTLTVTATINAAGAFDNSASANGTEGDPSGANNTDNTGNGGTAAVNPDTDGDGVPDTVEQAAPNGGDGNGDGVPDYMQNTVASLPAATGSGYLTLTSSCQLLQVVVTTEGAQPAEDPGFVYPHGLIAFRAPCSSATFSLYVYGSAAVSTYRKYGPNPPGGPAMWYTLPGASFGVTTVGTLHPRKIDFNITDGGVGDDTIVDGVIVDQGGPGNPEGSIPTLSEWALIAMAMAMAAFAALKLRT